ncbi:STAS domain-containing protein [Dethiothermospora halolimnae]|uniref:STAS domain-containing protein n=1 Tax=Dethiothermospora halolimnae TaxID=3114390 RepID=UPI003CCBA3AD
MALQILKEENNDVIIIKPVGEVDIYTSPDLKETLTEIINQSNVNMVIDGEKLEYIDSTGLGVLIGALKKIKEKERNITITNIKPNIKKLFDITGLNKVFVVKE